MERLKLWSCCLERIAISIAVTVVSCTSLVLSKRQVWPYNLCLHIYDHGIGPQQSLAPEWVDSVEVCFLTRLNRFVSCQFRIDNPFPAGTAKGGSVSNQSYHFHVIVWGCSVFCWCSCGSLNNLDFNFISTSGHFLISPLQPTQQLQSESLQKYLSPSTDAML